MKFTFGSAIITNGIFLENTVFLVHPQIFSGIFFCWLRSEQKKLISEAFKHKLLKNIHVHFHYDIFWYFTKTKMSFMPNG